MFNTADDELFDAGEGGKSAKWQMGFTCSARLLNHNLFSLSQLIVWSLQWPCDAKHNSKCQCTTVQM